MLPNRNRDNCYAEGVPDVFGPGYADGVEDRMYVLASCKRWEIEGLSMHLHQRIDYTCR